MTGYFGAAIIALTLLSLGARGSETSIASAGSRECVQDTMWQNLLVQVVRDDFLLDSATASARKRWGWKAKPNEIRAVIDEHLCVRARQAVEAYGYNDRPLRPLLVVRAGNLYVAQPADTGDTWFFLSRDWRVLDMFLVPS